MDSITLQKAYEELGRELIRTPSEKKKCAIIKEFCRVNNIPYVHSDGTIKAVGSKVDEPS